MIDSVTSHKKMRISVKKDESIWWREGVKSRVGVFLGPNSLGRWTWTSPANYQMGQTVRVFIGPNIPVDHLLQKKTSKEKQNVILLLTCSMTDHQLIHRSVLLLLISRSYCTVFISPPSRVFIRKTCPCNEYPLKPHLYVVKLGYAGVYLFFLFLLQNIDCGYSLEPPRRTHNLCFEQKYEKYQFFQLKIFNF